MTTTWFASSSASSWSWVTSRLRDAELAVELVEPPAEVLADLRVERAERLVQQQDLGAGRQGARERDPLPLASGELVGVALGEVRELDELEQLVDAPAPRATLLLPHAETELHVLRHGHVAEQGVVLEDEAHAAVLHALGRELLVAHEDPSGRGLFEPGDHPQHRALPRARGPEQRRHGALRRDERHVVDGDEVSEPLGQLLHHDRACSYRVSSPLLAPAPERLEHDEQRRSRSPRARAPRRTPRVSAVPRSR